MIFFFLSQLLDFHACFFFTLQLKSLERSHQAIRDELKTMLLYTRLVLLMTVIILAFMVIILPYFTQTNGCPETTIVEDTFHRESNVTKQDL